MLTIFSTVDYIILTSDREAFPLFSEWGHTGIDLWMAFKARYISTAEVDDLAPAFYN